MSFLINYLRMNKQSNNMTFFDHVNELRYRILISIVFIFIFTILSYINSSSIIDFLIQPVVNKTINFQVLKITSLFFIKIGVSIIFGILISFPFVLFQTFKFILPAFKKLSLWKIILFTIISYILFLLGLLFGYKVIIPISIAFFSDLSIGIDYVNLNYTLENYLSYIVWILVVSSIIFQFPFILVVIVKTGLLTVQDLIKSRRYIIVTFFMLGALLTPPDPLSQIFIVVPLCLLFEFSLLFIKILK